MKKALITGGAGFIGSHVARHCLDLGMEVTVIDNFSGGFKENIPEGCRWFNMDINDVHAINGLFDNYRFDYVYHLAAYAAEILSPHIKNFNYMNNVVGSMNIINACVNYDVECLVFTSSIAVNAEGTAPYQENDPFRPGDDYGNAKMCVEFALHQTLDRFGLNYVIFRPFNVFGENQNIGDRYRNVIGIFMNQIMQGKPLTVFGDGEQRRAFSYIDDVAPHIAKSVLRKDLYRSTFFIGGQEHYSINELIHVIAAEFGVIPDISYLEQRHETKIAYACVDRATSAFGPPKVDLQTGIHLMADWAKKVGARQSQEFKDIEIRKNLPEGW